MKSSKKYLLLHESRTHFILLFFLERGVNMPENETRTYWASDR